VVPVIAYPTAYVHEALEDNAELVSPDNNNRKRSLSTSGSSSDDDVDLQGLSLRAQNRYRKKLLTKMFVPSTSTDNGQPQKKGAGYLIKAGQEKEEGDALANSANTKIVKPATEDSDAIVEEISEDVKPPRKKPSGQQKGANKARYMRNRLPSTAPIPAAIFIHLPRTRGQGQVQ
jgi:hypothetical protein